MKKREETASSGRARAEAEATRREEGLRLDLFMASAFPALSRKEAKRLIDGRRVAVNGKLEPMASRLLRAGDRVSVRLRTPASEAGDEALRLSVVHEDESCLAVSKPAGIPSGPTRSGSAAHAQALASRMAARPLTLLHRLDKETSGVLLLAKTSPFAETLLAAFRAREVEKVYLAVVRGTPPNAFHATSLLEEGEGGRMHVVGTGGAKAETDFRTLRSKGGYSLLEARPRTGRTHQIRVQLARAGHPILGDALYRGDAAARVGGAALAIERQMLHAWKLSFFHPELGRSLELTAPPPEDFRLVVEELFGAGTLPGGAGEKRSERGPAPSGR
jgi:23S rRNA pseudouridine1911/1915/1917 synthase